MKQILRSRQVALDDIGLIITVIAELQFIGVTRFETLRHVAPATFNNKIFQLTSQLNKFYDSRLHFRYQRCHV